MGFELIEVIARELLLFAGVWMAVGLVDELVIETLWVFLKLRGRGRALAFDRPTGRGLAGPAAVFIPCWQEAGVIAATLRRCCEVWPHPELLLFVGIYPNDAETLTAASEIARADPRVMTVVVPHDGPTPPRRTASTPSTPLSNASKRTPGARPTSSCFTTRRTSSIPSRSISLTTA
jgi:adsorption protein B